MSKFNGISDEELKEELARRELKRRYDEADANAARYEENKGLTVQILIDILTTIKDRKNTYIFTHNAESGYDLATTSGSSLLKVRTHDYGGRYESVSVNDEGRKVKGVVIS